MGYIEDEQLPGLILEQYEDLQSWRLTADLPEFKGINFVTLRRYAYGDPVLDDEHREILNLKRYELAPICSVHGKACVLDCNKERKVKRKGRKRAPRVEIAAGTPPDEVVAKLERIGHRVKYE